MTSNQTVKSPGLYKEVSRTFFSLRRRRGYFPRHPAPVTIEDASLGSCPWDWVCVVPSHWFHFLVATTPISFETIKPCGCTVSTMDLSEARGLGLFRVIRGGIGITQRLGARHRLQAIVILTLEPERLKNRLATTRKNHRRWKGSSPETLKRLAILVFLRRSSLLSSTESVLWRLSCGLA